MTEPLDWNDVPEAQMQAYLGRLEMVETLLEESIDELTKKELKEQYCFQCGITDRTLRNYIAWYKAEGPMGLLFYHRPLRSLRINDADLRDKIISLIHDKILVVFFIRK